MFENNCKKSNKLVSVMAGMALIISIVALVLALKKDSDSCQQSDSYKTKKVLRENYYDCDSCQTECLEAARKNSQSGNKCYKKCKDKGICPG